MVDIDLETVISFCDKFEKEYLSVLHANAARLKTAASSASSTLGNTAMATGSSAKLDEVAAAIYKASSVGEERIRELRRKAQQELDDKNRIEDMCR